MNSCLKKINNLCNEAQEYEEMNIFDLALKNYNEALELIPEEDNDEYDQLNLLINTSIGDITFNEKKYSEAMNWYYEAKDSGYGFNNPYVIFSIGKCFYEQGKMEKAKEYFIKTYMLSEIDIFCSEDMKYYNLIEELI
ncbi:MAG: hypothetical protein PUE01_12880 [Clostridiaceae bacterium]|nr:hypothetical protein [Clostridiaceae bacterium]